MKVLKKLVLLSLSLCFVFQFSFGQKCLSSEKKLQSIANNPLLIEALEDQEAQTQRWIAQNQHNMVNRAVVTLPVVVHVVWRDAEENISDDQIYSQIAVLNEDFRKLNNNFTSGPAVFQSIGADVEIEFCLASIDPNGNPTTGITRTETSTRNIGNKNFYSSAQGGKDAWDVSKYINIWVCSLGSGNTLGFASLPGTADPPESDGIVIAPQFFGTTGSAANSTPNDLGRTTTHEVGHYLNLEHTWGLDGGCNDDDLVNDTPNQDEESTGCPTFPFYDNCTFDGNGIMFNNFMDYADDACMTMFTQGQKSRMLAALNGPRASLLTSNVCNNATSNEHLFSASLSIYPNPTRGVLFIQVENAPEIKPLDFSIYNLMGQKLKDFQVRGNLEINLSDLSDGIYMIKSQQYDNLTRRIIIAK